MFGKIPYRFVLAGLLTSLAAVMAMPAAANDAHLHIGHVMTGWSDTPGEQGFLPVALQEAEVAQTHAGLAASDPDSLENMQLHSRHVLHALDPAAEANGPGAGYGVLKATQGVNDHIGFAAGSEDASDAVKLHATHVSAAAEAAIGRAEEAKRLIAEILQAPDAATAAPLVAQLGETVSAIQSGADLNGDGTIGWADGEGGLDVAETHMGFMMDAEGL